MRQRQLFAQVACFVCADALTAAEIAALECCLRDGGAEIVADLEVAGAGVTHVVCHPQQYARFLPRRNERFVAIVRPEWVFKCFLLQTVVSVDRFSANPALIFSSLVISAGPIDKDPRKVIDGLIVHFGGQIVENESDAIGATHVLALDEPSQPEEPPVHHHWLHLSYAESDVLRSVQTWKKWLLDRPASLEFALPSCVVAWLGKVTGLSEQHHVTYSWIEDCVRRKARVPEGAFSNKSSDGKTKKAPSWKTRPEIQIEEIGLGSCARVYHSDAGSIELTLARKSSSERTAALQAALSGVIVLLAQHIPPVLKERISEVLKSAKAKVAVVPLGDSYEDIVKKVVANASFVVCRYQAGVEYDEAVRQKKRIVSIYWVLAGHSTHDATQTPFQEAISRPVKSFGGIPGMQGFVITLSGYSSRTTPTREDIQIAIHATGACMLPVLSRTHSTHLLCYEPNGEKFKKAQSWLFENIVSHEWLFQCLGKWELVAEDAFRFKSPKSAGAAADSTTIAEASDATNDSKPQLSTAAAAAAMTPRSKLANARFDVDDILTELNETTPGTKPGGGGGGGGADSTGSAKAAPKDVACKLFDTPTAESKGKEESAGSSGKKTGTKRGGGGSDAPEKAGPRKRRATAATASTSPSKVEPDNEDDVDDTTDLDSTAKATSSPMAPKTGKSSAKKETRAASAKRVSPALAQASTVALEALSVGSTAKKATPSAASGKRKRGQSLHNDGDASTDTSTTTTAPQSADQPSKAASKSKKARASVPPPAEADEAKPEVAATAAAAPAKKASPPKSSVAPAKAASAKKQSATKKDSSKTSASEIVFLLTGTREETAVNESIIGALGGTVSQTGRKFDHSSTHIICSELKRTEKFVAGCAGGKWILKPSYLEASSAAGRFVDETPHEWGADGDDSALMDPRIWPQAAAFWRKARAEGQPGAFVGWRFLVHPKCVPPPDMCERVIEASDGVVVPLTKSLDLAEVIAGAAQDAKPLYALVPGELPTRDPWLKKFSAQKVECLNASFLIDYVTKDQSKRPKPDSYRV